MRASRLGEQGLPPGSPIAEDAFGDSGVYGVRSAINHGPLTVPGSAEMVEAEGSAGVGVVNDLEPGNGLPRVPAVRRRPQHGRRR